MNAIVFGKSFSFSFNSLANGEPVTPHSLVSARLYKDAPTTTQIEDAGSSSTGHVERVTTWTDGEENEKLISFAAVVADDQHSQSDYETYYVVINFRFESGGPEVFDKEVVYIYRPDSLTSRFGTTYDAILAIEPDLTRAGLSTTDLTRIAAQAKDRILNRLDGADRNIRRMFNLEKLNLATLFKGLEMACWSRYRTEAPHWKDKALEYKTEADLAYAAARPGLDMDGDDEPAPTEAVPTGGVYLQR